MSDFSHDLNEIIARLNGLDRRVSKIQHSVHSILLPLTGSANSAYYQKFLPNTKCVKNPSDEKNICEICQECCNEINMICDEKCNNCCCRQCFIQHLAVRIDEGDHPLACLFCKRHFDDSEITQYLDDFQSSTLQKNLINRIFAGIPNSFHCPMPDCQYFAEVVPPNTLFNCPLCDVDFCTACHSKWHQGQCENKVLAVDDKVTCQQRCPKCTHGVEKRDGCNHIRCRCGTNFCYLCNVIFDTGKWEEHACDQFGHQTSNQ